MYPGPPAGWGPCGGCCHDLQLHLLALHLCLFNVCVGGRHWERTAFQDSQLGREGEAGLAPCGGYPRPWTPVLVSLMLTSTFLLLSHGTLRPAGGGSALIAMDGGVVACPGCPPACTCAASASLRTAHCCRSPGAQLLGCFPEELCAACTWRPPAFSPASRGPRGTPSRHLWESREARLPRTLGVWAEGPNLDRLPTHRGP